MNRSISTVKSLLQKINLISLLVILNLGIVSQVHAGQGCVTGPTLIPDNNLIGIKENIVVGDNEIIKDLNVFIFIAHSSMGQLIVRLRHVDTAQQIDLVVRPGHPTTAAGCQSKDLNVVLDDEGPGGPVEDLCGSSSSSYTPVSPPAYTPHSSLSVFDGEDINGTWELTIIDAVLGETGSFSNACLSWNTADVGVSVSPSEDLVGLGSSYSHTVAVTNNGTETAENVMVTHQVPVGTEVTRLESQNGAAYFMPLPAGAYIGQVQWALSELAAGQTEFLDMDWEVSRVRTPQIPAPPFIETTVLEINSPADLPSEMINYPISFDSTNPAGVTAGVVLVNDGDSSGGGSNSDGCQPFLNAADVNGKIALIDYGIFPLPPGGTPPACTLPTPIVNAINAGAVGLLIANEGNHAMPLFVTPPPPSPNFSIPIVAIGEYNGQLIKNKLSSNSVSATIRLGFQNVWMMWSYVMATASTTDTNPQNDFLYYSTDLGYDTDQDGVPDVLDQCPEDISKTKPGQCGCGQSDKDSDGDGVANCNDACASDANKTAAGVCGCGKSDKDSDGDGVADCNDACASDSSKTTPGVCGCNVPDVDANGNGIIDCLLSSDLKAQIGKATELLGRIKKSGKGGKAIKKELRALMAELKTLVIQQAGSINLASASVKIKRLVRVAAKKVNKATKSRGTIFKVMRKRARKALKKLNNGIAG